MNKRYCIFDMDGTLVNSMGYWKYLEREFLESKGVTGARLEDVLVDIQHLTVPEACALFIERFGFHGTVDSITDEFNALMAEHYRTDIEAKPGVPAYLDALQQRGVTMCIASATSTPLVKICLEHLNLTQYFDFILSCVDVGSSKDKPEVFLEAARRLGAAPADVAVFEDSAVAAATAKNAGFYVVGIYDAVSAHNWPVLQELCDELIEDWESHSA